MSFDKHDIRRNACQLYGKQSSHGYDWWWHSFTAINKRTGEEKPFFVEFFLCNPSLGGDEAILGQKKENKEKGRRPSYLMVKVGCWGEDGVQLHRFFPWSEVKLDWGVPFSLEAGDCVLNEESIRCSVNVTREEAEERKEMMSDSGEISMDLKIKKLIPFNVGYGAGPLFRKLQLFEMFWHAEGMKSTFEGTVIFNGEEYVVEKESSYGYADKNWGKDFTSPWVWLSSNNLKSEITGKKFENSVFDIGGGCPKVGFIKLKRKLLSAFYYEGRCFEFNFSKFWTFCRTSFDCHEEDDRIIWHVEQKTLFNRMVADIECKKKDMLLVAYESPDGEKRHNRLWNGGNGRGRVQLFRKGKLVDSIWAENVGSEYGEYC